MCYFKNQLLFTCQNSHTAKRRSPSITRRHAALDTQVRHPSGVQTRTSDKQKLYYVRLGLRSFFVRETSISEAPLLRAHVPPVDSAHPSDSPYKPAIVMHRHAPHSFLRHDNSPDVGISPAHLSGDSPTFLSIASIASP